MRRPTLSRHPFHDEDPVRSVAAGALLTLLLTILFAIGARGILATDKLERDLARLQAAVFDIATLDRALTRATRTSLAAGDAFPRDSHAGLEQRLTRVMAEVQELAGLVPAEEIAGRIERSSTRLRRFEREALRLAQEGRSERASELFSSEAYATEREQLRSDLEFLSDITANQAQAVLDSADARVFWTSLLAGLGALALFGAWWRVFGQLSRYVSERDAAEAELRTSERRYRLTVQSITDYGIATLDAAGNILTWSPGAEMATGYPQDEVVGRPFTVTHGSGPGEVEDPSLELENAASADGIYHDGWRVRRDGMRYWSREIIAPITGAGGELLGYAMITKDLSREKAAAARERQLIEEREQRLAAEAAQGRIRSIVESITDALLVLDDECRFTYLNRKAEQVFGRKTEDLLGRKLSEQFPQLEKLGITGRIQRALADRRPTEFEVYYAPFSAWFEVRAYPAADGLSIYFHDITERKRSEEALRRSEERYSLISRASHDAIWEFNFPTGTIEWNAAFTELFGGSAATLDEWVQRIQPNERDEVLKSFEAAVAAKQETWTGAYQLSRADGRYLDVLSRAILQYSADGAPLRAIGSLMDITDLKRTEAELLDALNRAERAGRAKSEMLSRASHELRTPMNAILGFAQLLEKEIDEPENRESVEMILQAGRNLLSLIDRLLAVASAESGYLTLNLEPQSVQELVTEVVTTVKPLAEQCQVDLTQNSSGGCAYEVTADAQRLKQVLSELLSNAIHYNHEGGAVTIACGPGEEGLLRIEITDTGPGITPEELAELFEPFIRRAGGRRVAGPGMGLPVCKALVEAMNGRLSVESVPGDGSTFRVELPLASASTSPSEETEAGSVENGRAPRGAPRILYIEDTPANMRLVERMMKRSPLDPELICAETGRAGLELARTRAPDLILLDLNLPDLSGEDVLSTLLLDESTAAIPIVMISGDALPDNIQRLRSLGLAHYLTKPFTMQGLLDVVHDVLNPSGKSRQEASS